MLGLQTSLLAFGAGKAGGLASFGKMGSIGSTGIFGKLGIIMLLGRLGLHGIWATGAFFILILLVLVGIFYSLYKYRMRNVSY